MATLKDIAKASGVSAATVSQVLNNGRRPVHSLTRERVLHAAKSLDYSPNAVARGLIQKRMNTLGLVFLHGETSTQSNPFLIGVLDGVLSVSTRRNQRTTLCTLTDWDMAGKRLSDLSDGRCDGVLLLVPPAGCPLIENLRRRKVPFVVVNGEDRAQDVSCVDIDNAHAAYRMTEALLEMGHRRIGFVHRKYDWNFAFTFERQKGYQAALTAHGLYDPALANLLEDDFDPADMRKPDSPTALFCCFDVVALSVLEKCRLQGVRVPEDVSIVGFDDIPDAAARRLTTVHQPITSIGERAAEVLLALIEGKEEPGRHIFLTTELIFRESTAPPPGL